MNRLFEDSRSKLLSKSKKADNYAPSNQHFGKNRYERRLKSRVSHSVRDYNSINMNRLFKDNLLDVSVQVTGETDTYHVKIAFGGFLDYLHTELERNNEELNLKVVSRALVSAFNSDDVYIFCSCADWKYRFSYFATKNSITSGDPENRPSDITNPRDTKGSGCKHVLLVLNNTSWLLKVASVIFNYVNYMEKHYQRLYADVIYPAIYQKKYEEPVQMSIDDTDELETNSDVLDKSNKYAKTKTQFQKGNEYRFKANPNVDKQLDFDSLLDDEE